VGLALRRLLNLKTRRTQVTVPIAQPEMVVRKSIVVNVPQAHAFTVFTTKFGSWWPLESHHIGKATAQTAILEPRAGGRWFERGDDVIGAM
jgi:hypothetical protein